jgi:hypothetical protein
LSTKISFFSWDTDAEYRKFVACQLKKYTSKRGIEKNEENRKKIYAYHEKLLSVYLLDFDSIRGKLAELYSDKSHRHPFDPQAIIRSLMLMKALGEVSITKWVTMLELEPLVAIFTGIHPDNLPSVGTYYNFLNRLENGAFVPKSSQRILNSDVRKARMKGCIRSTSSKPKQKPEHGENIGVMQKCVNETGAAEKDGICDDLEARLNHILLEIAVKPSVDKKLMSRLDAVRVGGDGSTLKSDSSYSGKRLCSCRSKGIFRCDHNRKYSDPDSAWGIEAIRK